MKRAEGSGRRIGAVNPGATDRPTAHRSLPITVRQARPEDLPTVVALRLSLLREHADHPIYGRIRADAATRARELFATQLDSSGEVMFLAERAGKIVGILRCIESTGSPLLNPGRYCYVSSVFVTPESRRTGVLHALLDHATAWCMERGLDEMRLHSVAGDQVSEAAWEALGFGVVEYVRLKRLRA